MIFITLGSQKFQFNRLLKEIDNSVKLKKINMTIYAQVGYSDYEPQNYSYKKFLDRNEFAKRMDEAEIVITHGGTGAIMGAIKKGKKVIAVPRLSKYNEHVDDHQLQIVKEFVKKKLIVSVENIEEISSKISDIYETDFTLYESNTMNFITDIDDYINNI